MLECFYGGGFFERKFFEAKKDGEKSYIRTSWIENMGRDKIVALSKILDVSPLEILGIPETEETPFVVPTNIMNIYKQLTTENQEAVFRYAQKKLTEQNYF